MSNLFLFTGEETFLLHQQLKSWQDAFKEKHGDLNLIILDGEQESVADIASQLQTAPFLGDKRLVIIHGIPESAKDKTTKKDEKREEELKKLEAALNEIPETSVVVLVQPKPDKRKSLYKKIVQEAQLKTFEPLTNADLAPWVMQHAKSLNVQVEPNAAQYLVMQVGHNLWRLDSELSKLATYSQEKPIDREAIDHLVMPSVEANVFHLTDALGAKNHQKAIQSLHRVMAAGENLRQTFYMIVRQFRLLLQIQSYVSQYPSTTPQNIATTLKIHSFVAKNTLAQVKNFQADELKQAYNQLLDIDVALKNSGIRITTDDQDELALAIEQFILNFCCPSEALA